MLFAEYVVTLGVVNACCGGGGLLMFLSWSMGLE